MSVTKLAWNECREITLRGQSSKRNAIFFGGFSVSAQALSRLGHMLNEKWKAGVRMTSLPRHNCSVESFLRSRGWHYAIEGRREFFSFCSNTAAPVIAGGNSTGALIALIAAALHPDKVAGVVALSPALLLRGPNKIAMSALVLTAYYLLPAAAITISAAKLRKEIKRGKWREGAVRHMLYVIGAFAVQQMLQRSSLSLQRSAPYLEDGLEVMHPRHDRAGTISAASLLPLQFAVLALLTFVKAPVCLIIGADDEVVNYGAVKLAASLLGNCELHVLSGGHRLLSDPHYTEVAEIVDRFCGKVWNESPDAA